MTVGPVNDSGLEAIRKSTADLGSATYALRVMAAGGLVPSPYDTITATYPTAASEVYTYSYLAAPVGTVTVTYTDATKETLSTVVRA